MRQHRHPRWKMAEQSPKTLRGQRASGVPGFGAAGIQGPGWRGGGTVTAAEARPPNLLGDGPVPEGAGAGARGPDGGGRTRCRHPVTNGARPCLMPYPVMNGAAMPGAAVPRWNGAADDNPDGAGRGRRGRTDAGGFIKPARKNPCRPLFREAAVFRPGVVRGGRRQRVTSAANRPGRDRGANPARFRGLAPWEPSPRARQKRGAGPLRWREGPERGLRPPPRSIHGGDAEAHRSVSARADSEGRGIRSFPEDSEDSQYSRHSRDNRKFRGVRGGFRRVGAFGPRRDPWWVR